MAQSVVETCEICNQALGIDFCEECEQTFCNHCKLMHLRMKISRNHTFKNVDHEEVKLNLCDQHNLGYILYCEKCNSLACKTCIIENHKGHELEDINIAKISELQVEVSEKLESYSKEIHEGSRNSPLLMKDQMKNHEKACKKAIEEINCRSNAIKSCVDKIVDSYTTQILQKEENQNRKANAYIDAIENLVENLYKIKREYWTILDKRSGVALLKSLQKFQKDNNNLDLEIPVVPSLGQTLAARNRCKCSVFDMTVGLFDDYNFD
ncbi:tripartite motif-containing protein 33 [Mytilus galloprovincialis]|uniref:Tripartite motif-containing protein 33 n=1 Tax=Mytilus galloprovincialis TaxID=29158 RepID=A0A8B6HEH8_MYTGA|nr:tripartite motif-containing protein 33 [Mytilus galloprovincialis]